MVIGEEIAMNVRVKIYTTPTCGYCMQAKEFLTAKGVAFESVDVSQDKEALLEMKRISGGARSVPVISVGERVIVGFERDELEKALGDIG
jgi:alkyl hydroperoxide reductase subunit F